MALGEYRKSGRKALAPHTSMGEYLMMYEGLVLYVKEMDEDRYQRLCSVSSAICYLAAANVGLQSYISTISSLHQNEAKDLLMGDMATINATAAGDGGDICR
jgi:hypothetical protein